MTESVVRLCNDRNVRFSTEARMYQPLEWLAAQDVRFRHRPAKPAGRVRKVSARDLAAAPEMAVTPATTLLWFCFGYSGCFTLVEACAWSTTVRSSSKGGIDQLTHGLAVSRGPRASAPGPELAARWNSSPPGSSVSLAQISRCVVVDGALQPAPPAPSLNLRWSRMQRLSSPP